ncbi:uroporphyrin-III C-methyltransferase [Kappamyces sp. JEL0829]|nr:uroporphyrin-III C-methyltransferase [Kappamyces sp. JEL0829]
MSVISTTVKLEQKHVLVAVDQTEECVEPLETLVLELIQSECIVTVACPVVLHTTALEKCHARGEFGWLKRSASGKDAQHYHWVICLSDRATTPNYFWKDIREGCLASRTLFTLANDESMSDIAVTTTGTKAVPALSGYSTSKAVDVDDSLSLDSDSLMTLARTNSLNSLHDFAMAPSVAKRQPRLYLVGVGPGSPDLLTIKAHRLLHTVPVIISDRLVCNDIFSSIPSTTRVLFSRKICGKANAAQNEINQWILEALHSGRLELAHAVGLDVMRIKGGDPFVYGRGGEEWELAHRAGFHVDWVPGISSCIAAAGRPTSRSQPGAAGIPVTHRGVADSFVLATGQKEDGSAGGVPAYSPTRTLVLLMAVGVLDKLGTQLAVLGYPLDSRVAVVHRATWPDQQVVRGSLMTIAAKVREAGIKNHAAIIVGRVVDCLSREPFPLFPASA